MGSLSVAGGLSTTTGLPTLAANRFLVTDAFGKAAVLAPGSFGYFPHNDGFGIPVLDNKVFMDVTSVNTALRISTAASSLIIDPLLVANLPAVRAGLKAMVSDALGPVFGNAVVGGGAVNVPVYCDGATWKVG